MGDCFMCYHLSLQCHFYYGVGPLIHVLGRITQMRIQMRAQFNMKVEVYSFTFYFMTNSLDFPRSHESGLNSFGGGAGGGGGWGGGARAPFPNSGL